MEMMPEVVMGAEAALVEEVSWVAVAAVTEPVVVIPLLVEIGKAEETYPVETAPAEKAVPVDVVERVLESAADV
jgi:hypothetical protein